MVPPSDNLRKFPFLISRTIPRQLKIGQSWNYFQYEHCLGGTYSPEVCVKRLDQVFAVALVIDQITSHGIVHRLGREKNE
jgi:hypothetical protein